MMYSSISICVAPTLLALLLPIHASPAKGPTAEQSAPRAYEHYLNASYYDNFPPSAVNFRPRMQMTTPFYDRESVDEENGAMDGDLAPSKTVPGTLMPRKTFSFLCPTSIECPDAGCCAIGSRCAIIEGQVGCCDLPMYTTPLTILPPFRTRDTCTHPHSFRPSVS